MGTILVGCEYAFILTCPQSNEFLHSFRTKTTLVNLYLKGLSSLKDTNVSLPHMKKCFYFVIWHGLMFNAKVLCVKDSWHPYSTSAEFLQVAVLMEQLFKTSDLAI